MKFKKNFVVETYKLLLHGNFGRNFVIFGALTTRKCGPLRALRGHMTDFQDLF